MAKGKTTTTKTTGFDKKGNFFTKEQTKWKGNPKALSSDEAKLRSQEMSGKTARHIATTTAVTSTANNLVQAVTQNRAQRDADLNKYLDSIISDVNASDAQREEEDLGKGVSSIEG